jgi:ADP-ribose pyrophosphatase YjhB (NUDIX family)
MDHDLRKQIVLKLIHTPRATYAQLWDKSVESNLFAYHLKKLEEEGLVLKYDDGYGLTAEGKKMSAFIEGDTGGKAEMPTPTVIILVRDGNKLLCQQRLKEPFYGYWGLPSGKINFGWDPKECAIRDLEEETGLVAEDAVLREIEFTKSFDAAADGSPNLGDAGKGKLLHHHIMFTYEVTAYSGTLKERTHKALNRFLTMNELGAMRRFPGDWSTRYAKPLQGLVIAEKERYIKGDNTDIKIVERKEYDDR